MNNLFIYVLQFLIGGIIFTSLYCYSKKKDTVISSIIPALPIVFLAGFIYIIYFNGEYKKYIKNSIYTFGISLLFVALLYLIITYITDEICYSLILLLIFFMLIVKVLINYKIIN